MAWRLKHLKRNKEQMNEMRKKEEYLQANSQCHY